MIGILLVKCCQRESLLPTTTTMISRPKEGLVTGDWYMNKSRQQAAIGMQPHGDMTNDS